MISFDAIQRKQLDSLFIARSSVWKDDLCSCYYQSTRSITNPRCARRGAGSHDNPHGQARHLQVSEQTENSIRDSELNLRPRHPVLR